MKKWFFIITFIFMFPIHVSAANLVDMTPLQFITAYNQQVKLAFKGLSGPYLKYMRNFIIQDVTYLQDKNCYLATVCANSKINIMLISADSNNKVKMVTVCVSDNHADCKNILFHYMDLITNAINMYGALDSKELTNVINGNQQAYIFNYRGRSYIMASHHGTYSSNINYSALSFAAR